MFEAILIRYNQYLLKADYHLKMVLAVYFKTTLKKDISSYTLANYLGITQKSTWFMLQRIREVMKNDNNSKFDGTTEIDEAYIGGSEINKHADKKNKLDL